MVEGGGEDKALCFSSVINVSAATDVLVGSLEGKNSSLSRTDTVCLKLWCK